MTRPRQGRSSLNAAEPRRIESRFVGVVVEPGHRVIVLVADRVVLVIVTSRTADRQTQKRRSHGVVPIDHVLDAILLVDRAVFRRPLPHSQERGREPLLLRRLRQQIARELPGAKLVERHIPVERADDPVAPRPQQTIVVVIEEPVALRPAREVAPEGEHVLAVSRRREQAIHDFFIRVRQRIAHERLYLFERGWKARERQRDAIDQRFLIGFLRGVESVAFEARQDEPIDIVHGAGGELDRRYRRLLRCDKRPMRLVHRALFDPLLQRRHLRVAERLIGRRRRHPGAGCRGRDAPNELALLWLPVHNRVAAHFVPQLGVRRVRLVEPQPCLPRCIALSMAAEAVVGEDGPDVPVEIDRPVTGVAHIGRALCCHVACRAHRENTGARKNERGTKHQRPATDDGRLLRCNHGDPRSYS